MKIHNFYKFALIFIVAASLLFSLSGCLGREACVHKDLDRNGRCDECNIIFDRENCSHADEDSDRKCDYCATDMPCNSHKDENENLRCDYCDAIMSCVNHIDENHDQKCDKCATEVPCTAHSDGNHDEKCDWCSANVPCQHKDADGNGQCDICFKCLEHRDSNENLKCDWCGKKIDVECTNHKDDDENLECDYCETKLSCLNHINNNSDSFCDKCSTCIKHKDENHDQKCDSEGCGASVPCTDHSVIKREDGTKYCEWCKIDIVCSPDHYDDDKNHICDNCKEEYHIHHYDLGDDCKCDYPRCSYSVHIDQDDNKKCDKCNVFISAGVIGPLHNWNNSEGDK